MKIKYDSGNDIKNIYSEVFEVLLQKEKILKKKKTKIQKFNIINTKRLILSSIVFIFSDAFFKINNVDIEFRVIWLSVILTHMVIAFYNQNLYKKNLKNLETTDNKGELIITKDSITDKFKDTEIKINLEKITDIFIGKYSISIFSDGFISFYLPINIKKDLINTITEYKKDIKIIEITKK